MFPDSEIASQFSMGKTKSRYMILNGLAPHFKSRLRKAIHQFIIPGVSMKVSILLSKSVNWMLMSDFGMNVEILSRLDIVVQNFWIDLMPKIFLRVLEMHPMGCDKKTSYN